MLRNTFLADLPRVIEGVEDDPVAAVLRTTKKSKAGLVVMGTHGHMRLAKVRNNFLRTVLNTEGSGDRFNRQGSPCLHRQDSDRAAWGLARVWGLAEECEVDEAIAAAAATTAAKNATVLAAECNVGY